MRVGPDCREDIYSLTVAAQRDRVTCNKSSNEDIRVYAQFTEKHTDQY